MTRRQFEEQWDLSSIPACEEGIELLRRFAQAHPDAHKFVQPGDFVKLNNPAFEGISEWDAFALHSDTCDKCNGI
jgi:hypothetical protein